MCEMVVLVTLLIIVLAGLARSYSVHCPLTLDYLNAKFPDLNYAIGKRSGNMVRYQKLFPSAQKNTPVSLFLEHLSWSEVFYSFSTRPGDVKDYYDRFC